MTIKHAVADDGSQRIGNCPPHAVQHFLERVLLEGFPFAATTNPPAIEAIVARVRYVQHDADAGLSDACPEGVEFRKAHRTGTGSRPHGSRTNSDHSSATLDQKVRFLRRRFDIRQ